MVRQFEDDRLLTAQEVAERWKMTAPTIYRYGNTDLLPKVTVGKRQVRFRLRDVLNFERELGFYAK